MPRAVTVAIHENLADFVEVYQRMERVDLDLSAFVDMALREYLERRGYRMPRGPFWITPAPDGGGDPTASIDHDRIIAEAHE